MTRGAVPRWKAVSGKSTSGKTTINSMRKNMQKRMQSTDGLSFHRATILYFCQSLSGMSIPRMAHPWLDGEHSGWRHTYGSD